MVQGSLRRYLNKGTNIKRGTQYMQLANCISLITIKSKFGRLDVRIYLNCGATENDLYGDYLHEISEGREDDKDRNNKSLEIHEMKKNYIFFYFLMNPTQLWHHKVSSLGHPIVQGLSLKTPM